VGSDSKNGVRHQRALSPRLSMMMMMMDTLKDNFENVAFRNIIASVKDMNFYNRIDYNMLFLGLQ